MPRRRQALVRAPAASSAAEPEQTAFRWREHDLMIVRFHGAALTPAEIAVVLNGQGLKVRAWHVSESFVRRRLKPLGLPPNANRLYYRPAENRYRAR